MATAQYIKRPTRNPGGPLGGAIRDIRLRMKRSQTRFARLLGWPQASLSQYESGDAEPSAERLIALLRLAENETERQPILKALEERGVLPSDLAAASVELPTCSSVLQKLGKVASEIEVLSDSTLLPQTDKAGPSEVQGG